MKRITLLAGINTYTGYGQHGIQIVRDLERLAGVYASIRPINFDEENGTTIPPDIRGRFVTSQQPEPWELLLHPPTFAPTPGKRTAYFTMHEATRLSPQAVFYLNAAEVVIVPSAWNASCFNASGVTSPIRIVPLGVDTKVFNFRPYPEVIKDLCVFGTAGRSTSGRARKGITDVILAFRAAFPTESDVRLCIKCLPNEEAPSFYGDERVVLEKEYLTDAEMAEWYAHLHCFVSAARAEGWGLMQHQALACGRPLISGRFGGVQEFFDGLCGFPLDYKLVHAEETYKGCGLWAEPDMASLVQQMRCVYQNRQIAIEKGFVASEKVRSWSWEESNRNLIGVLEEFGAVEAGAVYGRDRLKPVADCTYGVITYLPPAGVGHADVFLQNMAEHPPTGPVVYLTDGEWPNAVRIQSPTRWFKRSDEIASYVFLRAIQEAEARGWKYFVYLETDCRMIGKGWDWSWVEALAQRPGAIAAGNLAITNPENERLAIHNLGFDPVHPDNVQKVSVLRQGHLNGDHVTVPFVNGAPAVYCVAELRKLFPSQQPAHVAVQSGYNIQDRIIGDRAVEVHGIHDSLSRFVHVPSIMATAGESVYRYATRIDSLAGKEVSAAHPIKGRWRPAPDTGYVFYQSGDLGDLIYALKAIKLIGGGRLLLGPECKWQYPPRAPFTRDSVASIKPLLDRQKYLSEVCFVPKMTPDITHDMNHARVLWNQRTPLRIPIDNLCKINCYEIGVEPLFNADAWMIAGTKTVAKVVIHRSQRYTEKDFPWGNIVHKYDGDMIFVGLPEEHAAFCEQFGKVPFYQTQDFDEMAAIINGAERFVGNQSFPCALAIALGKPVLQETCRWTPDCVFERPTFQNQL